MKKILIPIEFNQQELFVPAIKTAEEMAQLLSAKLVFFHVVPPVPVSPGAGPNRVAFNVPHYEKEMMEKAEDSLNDLLNSILSRKIDHEVRIVLGNPADEVVKLADEIKADLIVVATHARSGLSRMFSGSVAEQILRHTTHPVLMLPLD